MDRQSLQKGHQDQHCHDRSWYVGEHVMVRNLRPGLAWIPGVVVERLGPVTYLVDVGHDQIWKRHSDQLQSIAEKPPSQAVDTGLESTESPNSTTQQTVPDRDSPEPEVIVHLPDVPPAPEIVPDDPAPNPVPPGAISETPPVLPRTPRTASNSE